MTPHDVRVAVYRVGAQVVTDCATLALAESGDPAVMDVIELAKAWPKPAMPVTGADLIARGFAPGPAMGRRCARPKTPGLPAISRLSPMNSSAFSNAETGFQSVRHFTAH